jgi:sugar lactone lactonase YvrE
MRQIVVSIMVCACTLITWVSCAQSYSSPESIEFDYANNRWLISNNGNGQILSRNSSTGALSVFASGIPSGPHGLEIVADTVYVCDGSTLKAYELQTAAQVFNINLGATFLNGITHDNSGYLYITDFSAKRIYRFNTADRTFTVFVSNTGTASPNGILYDAANNRCVFVNWGSAAAIKAVDLATGLVSTIANTSLGNCDGIAKDNQGNYYVSSWSSTSRITRFSNDFTTSTAVVTTGLSNPADIFYNALTDTLGVPNSGSGNNTTYYYFGSTSGVPDQQQGSLSLALNITLDEVNVQLLHKTTGSWKLMDYNGRLIQSESLSASDGFSITMKGVPSGAYILQLEAEGLSESRKIMWVK